MSKMDAKMDADLHRRYEFFLNFVKAPRLKSRVVSGEALDLACAERISEDAGLEFQWWEDDVNSRRGQKWGVTLLASGEDEALISVGGYSAGPSEKRERRFIEAELVFGVLREKGIM